MPSVATTAAPAAPSRQRGDSLANLLRMGHCAPSVMQALLDAPETEAEWLVKLTAGLPGGIGNTGGECGALTASFIRLGLRNAGGPTRDGAPVALDQCHDLACRFVGRNGTLLCREIRGHDRLPLRCIGVVGRAPGLVAATQPDAGAGAIRGERREAYARLCAHCAARGFHCAHAVFRALRPTVAADQALLDGTSAFIGGTAFMGMTCSAYTAGVMALGLALGEIEHSRLRVLRMIAIMAAGGNAFADDLNAFNRIMNLGHRLSAWFAGTFGSTQCRAITGCDFSTTAGAGPWIEGGGIARCAAIAEQVAARVRGMIEHARRTPPSTGQR